MNYTKRAASQPHYRTPSTLRVRRAFKIRKLKAGGKGRYSN